MAGKRLVDLLPRFGRDRRGATVVEYAIIIGVMSLAILAGVGGAMDAVKAVFTTNSEKLNAN